MNSDYCGCNEMRYTDEKGVEHRIPKRTGFNGARHCCWYVNARTKKVPEAERFADMVMPPKTSKYSSTRAYLWNIEFARAMERLCRNL